MPPNAERSSHASARAVRVGERAGGRDAARIRVLDDRAGRTVAEIEHELPRGVGVVVVEVRQREPSELGHLIPPTTRTPTAIARRVLVRVLAVAERFVGTLQRDVQVTRQLVLTLQPLHDRRVVGRGLREGFDRVRAARLEADRSRVRPHLIEEVVVLRGRRDDRDPLMVLRRGPRHRRATDVDRLDVWAFEERIKVRHNEVERHDAIAFEIGDVLGVAAIGEQPAVDLRVQRLHPAAEHLGRVGENLDARHRDFRSGDGIGRAARRHQLDTEFVQSAHETGEHRLVVH